MLYILHVPLHIALGPWPYELRVEAGDYATPLLLRLTQRPDSSICSTRLCLWALPAVFRSPNIYVQSR